MWTSAGARCISCIPVGQENDVVRQFGAVIRNIRNNLLFITRLRKIKKIKKKKRKEKMCHGLMGVLSL